MSGRKTKKNQILFENVFLGEFVRIITDIDTSETEQTDETVKQTTSSMAFSGYLLDQDEEYYYIGEEPTSISCALMKTCVKFIQIVTETTELDNILDQMPDNPKNKNEIN